jgi:hypothetical protein
MKRILFTFALFCAFFGVASAQTTLVAGKKVLDNTGGPLVSGQWCLGSSCVAVTNGAFSGSVTPSTASVTVTGSGNTYLTVPNVTMQVAIFRGIRSRSHRMATSPAWECRASPVLRGRSTRRPTRRTNGSALASTDPRPGTDFRPPEPQIQLRSGRLPLFLSGLLRPSSTAELDQPRSSTSASHRGRSVQLALLDQ